MEQENKQGDYEKLPHESETIKELQEIIQKLEKEKESYLEGWKRAKADLLNYKKEMEDKLKEFIKYSNEALILDLLPVLDSLDIAISNLSDQEKESSLGEGYILIQSQILSILKQHGLIELNPENQKFDPNFHEAIGVKKCERENCDKSDDNLIIKVLAKGYILNDKLIRPAKVIVITH